MHRDVPVISRGIATFAVFAFGRDWKGANRLWGVAGIFVCRAVKDRRSGFFVNID